MHFIYTLHIQFIYLHKSKCIYILMHFIDTYITEFFIIVK